MATVINGTTGVNKVQDGSITPEDLVQKMTLRTAQTASGTAVDFTGIPSWAKRITVMFNGVSTSGTSNIQIQLGTSLGFESTGYIGRGCSLQSGGSITVANAASGMYISAGNGSSETWNVTATLVNFSTNTFAYNSIGSTMGSLLSSNGSAYKTLSGTLDRIRITTVNGTDTFDAGTINIMYEG